MRQIAHAMAGFTPNSAPICQYLAVMAPLSRNSRWKYSIHAWPKDSCVSGFRIRSASNADLDVAVPGLAPLTGLSPGELIRRFADPKQAHFSRSGVSNRPTNRPEPENASVGRI